MRSLKDKLYGAPVEGESEVAKEVVEPKAKAKKTKKRK